MDDVLEIVYSLTTFAAFVSAVILAIMWTAWFWAMLVVFLVLLFLGFALGKFHWILDLLDEF